MKLIVSLWISEISKSMRLLKILLPSSLEIRIYYAIVHLSLFIPPLLPSSRFSLRQLRECYVNRNVNASRIF